MVNTERSKDFLWTFANLMLVPLNIIQICNLSLNITQNCNKYLEINWFHKCIKNICRKKLLKLRNKGFIFADTSKGYYFTKWYGPFVTMAPVLSNSFFLIYQSFKKLKMDRILTFICFYISVMIFALKTSYFYEQQYTKKK